jgi:hypothetical protein
MRLTRKISGCEDKSCEAVWETDTPGVMAVVGTTAAGDDLAGMAEAAGLEPHESIVLVTAGLLAGRASGA